MHNHNMDLEIVGGAFLNLFSYALLLFLIVGYLFAVYRTNKKLRIWPITRTVFWTMGVLSVYAALMGPIAERAHASLAAHMVTHLLLGMLGPLFFVLATPMTLLLRTVPVKWARALSKLLKSPYSQFATHPIVAGLLNVGGLWALYTTDLFSAMHSYQWLFVLVHVHLFLAGYVFTLSMIYVELTPHRTSFRLRAIVLVLSMAVHGILSKWIYANPPAGILAADAKRGGMLMYYGGDSIELVLIVILCYQYFSRNKRVTQDRVVSKVPA